MQISKCLLAVCAAVCALSVRAGDNDAQAKAREALEKKLNELQGQPPQAAPAPTAGSKPSPAPKPAQMPAAVPQATAVPGPPPADPEAIAKARAALEKKLNEMQAQPLHPMPEAAPTPILTQPPPKPRPQPQPAPVAAPPPPASVPAPVVPAAAATAQAPAAPFMSPVPAADPEAIARAREALREKMQTLQAQQPAPVAQQTLTTPAPATPPPVPAVPAAAVEPPPAPGINAPPEADPAAIAKARQAMRGTLDAIPSEADGSTPGKAGLNFPPLHGPALPVSADQEQRLRNLLQQYKLDLISPEQYQSARAKILAGP